MKMNLIRVQMMFVLVVPVAFAGGTDVGNGDPGAYVPKAPSISQYWNGQEGSWCYGVNAYLDNLVALASAWRDTSEQRSILSGGLREILDSYPWASWSFDPLTYSTIVRAWQINRIFPQGGTGDVVANLSMLTFIDVAKKVNNFDEDYFLPAISQPCFRSCARQGQGYCQAEALQSCSIDWDAFYVNYAKAASTLLESILEEKIEGRHLLAAMAKDEWEFQALLAILDWIIVDLNSDLFRRELGCVSVQALALKGELERHLCGHSCGGGASPGNRWPSTRHLRYHAEQDLEEISNELKAFTEPGRRCQK